MIKLKMEIILNRFFGIKKSLSIFFSILNNSKLTHVVSFIICTNIIVMISSSVAESYRINELDSFYFFKKHILFNLIGIVLLFLIAMMRKNNLERAIFFIFIVTLMLLILLPIFGISIKGSQRWINFKIITFQPSEVIKPSFLFINAFILTYKNKSRLIVSFLLLFSISFSTIIQPDIGMTLTILIGWLSQLFLLNVKRRIFIITPVFIIFFLLAAYYAIPYIHTRIDNFINGNIAYQVSKSILTFKNGGFFGQSIGSGSFKYQLPDVHTDYIFSLICEELGSLFAITLLFQYCKLFFIVSNESFLYLNPRDLSITISSALVLTAEAFINAGVALNLLPTKGMVFPFLSYGGSSTLANYLFIGIIINILYNNKIYKTYLDIC